MKRDPPGVFCWLLGAPASFHAWIDARRLALRDQGDLAGALRRHIAFLVDNLDAKLKEMGEDAKLTLGPIDMSGLIPGMRLAWLADPEGKIVEQNQGYVDEKNPPTL